MKTIVEVLNEGLGVIKNSEVVEVIAAKIYEVASNPEVIVSSDFYEIENMSKEKIVRTAKWDWGDFWNFPDYGGLPEEIYNQLYSDFVDVLQDFEENNRIIDNIDTMSIDDVKFMVADMIMRSDF